MVDAFDPLDRFLDESAALGDKRGPVLLQLPPSLAFDHQIAARFLDGFRERHPGDAVLEPRHPSWFEPGPEALLVAHRIARVAADPARTLEASAPGGWTGLRYWRWHGSPKMYWSAYPEAALNGLAAVVAEDPAPTWVMFDNTASGAAAADALALKALMGAPPCEAPAEPKD